MRLRALGAVTIVVAALGSGAADATTHTRTSGAVSRSPGWYGSFAAQCYSPGLWAMANPGPGSATRARSAVTCVPDPRGSGARVLKMKTTAHTCAWHCQRRVDWDSIHFITAGWNGYISIPILVPVGGVPASFGPSSGYGAMFDEQYGMPTQRSPSNALTVQNPASGTGAPVFAFAANTSGRAGGDRILWRGAPAADGHWHDFIEHFIASTHPRVGTIQLWQDAHPIRFSCTNSRTLSGCGTTTIHYPTLIPGATDQSANWVQINNYRNNGSATYPITYYHGPPAAGPTYASVAATLLTPPYGP
jgi:hypothetical protein